MDRRSGFILGGSGVACFASSACVEVMVGWGVLGVTDFGPPTKYKPATPAVTTSNTIAAMIGSKLRWTALTGFNEAGLPTSTEYTRTGSAMFFSCVVPRSLTARSRRDFTCRYASSERQMV